MKFVNTTILSAVDTASQTGPTIDTNQQVAASFMVLFGDATATGTVKIQASNDPVLTTTAVTNWIDIPNAFATIVAGAAALITVPSMAYRWTRAVYTRTGGGSSTVTVNMNSIGV